MSMWEFAPKLDFPTRCFIYAAYHSGRSTINGLARAFGVNRSTIRDIVKNPNTSQRVKAVAAQYSNPIAMFRDYERPDLIHRLGTKSEQHSFSALVEEWAGVDSWGEPKSYKFGWLSAGPKGPGFYAWTTDEGNAMPVVFKTRDDVFNWLVTNCSPQRINDT